MFAIPSLAIPSSTVRDLLNFAAASGALDAAAEFADQAICEWLARAREAMPACQSRRARRGLQAAQSPTDNWWPGGPERRVCARRREDSFLD